MGSWLIGDPSVRSSWSLKVKMPGWITWVKFRADAFGCWDAWKWEKRTLMRFSKNWHQFSRQWTKKVTKSAWLLDLWAEFWQDSKRYRSSKGCQSSTKQWRKTSKSSTTGKPTFTCHPYSYRNGMTRVTKRETKFSKAWSSLSTLMSWTTSSRRNMSISIWRHVCLIRLGSKRLSTILIFYCRSMAPWPITSIKIPTPNPTSTTIKLPISATPPIQPVKASSNSWSSSKKMIALSKANKSANF